MCVLHLLYLKFWFLTLALLCSCFIIHTFKAMRSFSIVVPYHQPLDLNTFEHSFFASPWYYFYNNYKQFGFLYSSLCSYGMSCTQPCTVQLPWWLLMGLFASLLLSSIRVQWGSHTIGRSINLDTCFGQYLFSAQSLWPDNSQGIHSRQVCVRVPGDMRWRLAYAMCGLLLSLPAELGVACLWIWLSFHTYPCIQVV
jgi:hypothetical protein